MLTDRTKHNKTRGYWRPGVLLVTAGLFLVFAVMRSPLSTTLNTTSTSSSSSSVISNPGDADREVLVRLGRQEAILNELKYKLDSKFSVSTSATTDATPNNINTNTNAALQEQLRDKDLRIQELQVKVAAAEKQAVTDIENEKQKQNCEMGYWNKRKQVENTLQNAHYKEKIYDHFALTDEDYKQKKMVDIGCGPRGSLEWADMLESRVCIDPLAMSYGALGSSDHKMLYIQADAEKIPIPDASIDIVSSINSLDHVFEPMKVLAEAKRVLRKGGYFLLQVHIVPFASPPCEPSVIPEDCHKWLEELGFEVLQKDIIVDENAVSFQNKNFRGTFRLI